MPTKKTAEESAEAASAAYEVALQSYAQALDALRKGAFAEAKDAFDRLQTDNPDEPELAERSRTYARICEQRMTPEPGDTMDPDARYYRAVVLSNNGQWDEALALLDGLIAEDPTSIRALYARASTWALKGVADRVVVDLRQAIAVDPKVRYQAVNDPDFERVREEPSFIDIIEPTPTGS